MDTFSTFHQANIITHVSAGSIALLLGGAALIAHKRRVLHKKIGKIFLIFLSIVILTGFFGVFVFGRNTFLVVITALSGYNGFSGYRTLQTKSNEPKWLDIIVAIATLATVFYFLYYMKSIGMIWKPIVIYSTVGGLIVLVGFDFLRYLIPREKYKNMWLYEHIYKMIGAFSALLAAFSGSVFSNYQPYSQLLPPLFGFILYTGFIGYYYQKLNPKSVCWWQFYKKLKNRQNTRQLHIENELRPIWGRLFDFDWKFGLFLILIICIPRFILVLNANYVGSYGFSIPLIMTISAIAPFVFLSKYGRKEIGITKPQNFKWLFIGLACGLLASFVLYFIGQILYDNSYQNWYQYIGKLYNIPATITQTNKNVMFAIVAITSMIFSPIGEELLFRGIVHSSFAKSIGEKKATLVDSSAFALTHISHFGLVFINNKWDFFTISTIIWVMSMFLMSLLFFIFRKKSNSILGAILCHAAFNLGMTFCIFYLL